MFAFLDDWSAILPRTGGHVISMIGAGGKTSLLEAVACRFATEGVPVVATTTTRTEPLAWAGLTVRGWSNFRAEPEPPTSGILYLVCDQSAEHPAEKWLGITAGQVDELGGLLPNHVVLVEADGGAGFPVKIHREGEPVMPARTSLAIPVIGLSAIGEVPSRILHRHGEVAAPWLDLADDHAWNWELMLKLLAAPSGYLGRIASHVPVLPALLQMDQCDDSIGLFGFVAEIMDKIGAKAVIMGDTSGPAPRLKTAIAASHDEIRGD